MEPQSLKEGWKLYVSHVVRADKSSKEYQRARVAFYSGAVITFALFDLIAHMSTDAERDAGMRTLSAECDAFELEMMLTAILGPIVGGD